MAVRALQIAQREIQHDPGIDILRLILHHALGDGCRLFRPACAVEQDPLDDARALIRAEATGTVQEAPTVGQLMGCDSAALCSRDDRFSFRLELDRAKTQHHPRPYKQGDRD